MRHSLPPPRRLGAALLAAITTAGLLAVSCGLEMGESRAPVVIPPGSTVVTLTFDDTFMSQTRAAALMNRYGLKGTFYVNSGRIGRSGYLSLVEVRSFADAGHEIGGHTVDHLNLDTLSASAARHQVCDDRVALMELGFPVTSFTYPFSGDSNASRQIVINCNYNSAISVGGIRNPFGCSSCPPSETIPPVDPFRARGPSSLTSDYDLADLQSLVTQVEGSGGGWMIMKFHRICGSGIPCTETLEITEALLDQFLAWLAPRSAMGTFVLTTDQVIGGALQPGIRSDGGIFIFPGAGGPDGGAPDAGAPDAGAPVGVPLQNPSLEVDGNGDNVPDCWKRQTLGTNSGGWLRTTDAHSGAWAQRARISNYTSGDRRLVVLQDSGLCAPAAVPGRPYRISAWYKTNSSAAFVVSYRAGGVWINWMSGPNLPISPNTYVRGEWITPPLPPDAMHISVGLSIRSLGELFMDDFALHRL